MFPRKATHYNLYKLSSLSFTGIVTMLLVVVGDCTSVFAQTSTADIGPNVTLQGNPGPGDVIGRLEYMDMDEVVHIVRPGTTVKLTVTATATGTNIHTKQQNRISDVSQWATKVPCNITPYRPGKGGGTFPDGTIEAPHTGLNPADPTLQNFPINCTWVFKWAYHYDPSPDDGLPPVHVEHTWDLLYFYSPGWYWYVGEARDNFGPGGYSFWSAPLGAYHCLTDSPK